MDSMSMENAFYSSSELIDLLFKGFTVTSLGGFIGVLIGIASISILYEGIRQVRDFFLNRFADTRKQSLIYQHQLQQLQPSTSVQQRSKRGRRGSGESGSSSTKRCDSIRYVNINKKSPIDDIGYDEEIGSTAIGPAGDAATRIVINGNRDANPGPEPGPSSALVPQQRQIPASYVRVRVEDLVLATLLHMVYCAVGYMLMLAVMTFNIWILVSVTTGVGIGYLIFGTFRRLDHLATHKRITIIECCEDGGASGDHVPVPVGRTSHSRAHGHSARDDSVGPEGPLLRSTSNSCSSSHASDTGVGYGATTQVKTTPGVVRDDVDEDPTDGEGRALVLDKAGH